MTRSFKQSAARRSCGGASSGGCALRQRRRYRAASTTMSFYSSRMVALERAVASASGRLGMDRRRARTAT